MLPSILLTLIGAASTPHVQVTLVSEAVSAQSGKPLSVGLRLVPEPGWHFYWTNPGDAGVPPSVAWKTLSGVTRVDSMLWPVPDTIPVEPLMTYGFHHETVLPFSVQVASDAKGKVRLSGAAKWLECKEICVPGKAELDLELPVAASAGNPDTRWQALFAKARADLPAALEDWTLRSVWTDSFLVVVGKGSSPAPAGMRFLPLQPGVADNPSPQKYQATADGFRLTIRRDAVERRLPDTLRGVLVPSSPWKGHAGVKLETPLGKASASDTLPAVSPPAKGAGIQERSDMGLWKALFLAFLGGVILNLMPCVLPVLSLKVLDLAVKGGQDRRVAFAHGAVYAAGVVASFLGLAAVLLVLRAGGQSLGWGFHLQSPGVVAALSLLMALIALNLWGVFEVGASLASKASGVESRGWTGSFLTGVTATLVATPCTAPFMGTALGYTLVLPAFQTLLVFAFLGLGMASPYLVLSAVPRLLAWMPKPGAWMETLKQALGFSMAAAAVWLGWLVGRLAGSDALAMVAATWVVVGTGGWLLGRYALGHRAPLTRWAARGAFAVCLALAAAGIAWGVGANPRAAQERKESVQERFSAGTLPELRASGKPWFLYFTADWCTTCLVNEGAALHRPAVGRKLAEKGVRVVKADWTSRDSLIGTTLASFGRQGVPYYVLSDGTTERALPEILTEGILLSALDSLKP